MGLCISVGALAWLKTADAEGYEWHSRQLATINAVLSANKLAPHHEPDNLPELASRAALDSFPYSFLHYLRRVYANVSQNPNWVPVEVADGEDPAADPAIDRELFVKMTSHLVCHSDAEGYYVPVDFPDVLYDERLAGGMLGSTPKLMRELISIAPALGITLTASSELSDIEAERINNVTADDGPWYRELTVWLTLYEGCRLSSQHKTAISFG
jgi:hypothetical protein